MKLDKKWFVFIIFGLLLIVAAFLLTGYNYVIQLRARIISGRILEQVEYLQSTIDIERKNYQLLMNQSYEPPLYIKYPNIEMPVKTIEGYDYIGSLEIPSLAVFLPVMSEWNEMRMKISPCRYTGSAYQDNLVICGHNYNTQFGSLQKLQSGDAVIFTDMDGNTFTYSVIDIENLNADQVEEMTIGDWDLTLFTCTIGRTYRVAVRCEKIND